MLLKCEIEFKNYIARLRIRHLQAKAAMAERLKRAAGSFQDCVGLFAVVKSDLICIWNALENGSHQLLVLKIGKEQCLLHKQRLLVCCFIAIITHFTLASSLDGSYLLSQLLELNCTSMRTRVNTVYSGVTYIALKQQNNFLLQQAHCWIKCGNKACRSI